MPDSNPRIPLLEPLETRDATTAYDRKMVNGIAEQGTSGTLRLLKRPGQRVAFNGQVGVGQGVTNYLNSLYSISGDFLNAFGGTGTANTANLATAAAAWKPRDGALAVGFAGKLWIMGGWVNPTLAAPTFTATLNGTGNIATITATSNGVGYSPGYPTSLNLIISGGGGSGGAAHVTVSGQSITGTVTITNAGSGYTSPPSVTIASIGWGIMNDVWNSVDGVNWNIVTGAAPWGQRGRGGAIVFNGKMWIMGGATGTGASTLDRTYGDVWSTSDGITWTQTNANAWPGRRRFGLCLYNGLMWIAGGAGLLANGNNWPNTYFSDVWSTADGVAWTKVVGQAAWVARANFAFFAANNSLHVVGGVLTDPFALATSDSWSSTDGANWSRTSSNPFGVAASTVWPVAAFDSPGDAYTIPPPVTVNSTGTGGTLAAAWCFNDFYDDDDNDDDMSAGPLLQVTFSNVGSGYNTAPLLTFGTSTGFNAGAYAFLNGTANAGAKNCRSVVANNGTVYILEFEDGSNYVHTVWTTTDGVTLTNLNVTFPGGLWTPRNGEWFVFGNLWMAGGIDASSNYYNDVWFIPIGGNATALTPNVPLGFYHFNQTSTAIATPLLVFKSTKDLYSYNASLNFLAKLSSVANYPATTVPGLVYLDGYFFVMDPQGRIWNSAINDPGTWTALGVIAMQNEPNGGVAIAKVANFVVGFGVWTMEFFWDAAVAAPASPLAPNTTLPIQVGCAAGESVIEMQGSVVWIGQTKREGQGVYLLGPNYNPERISTPFVDRILQNDPLTVINAFTLDVFGHSHYILNLNTSNITLTYDFSSGIWSVWSSLSLGAQNVITSLIGDPYGTVTAVSTGHTFADGDPATISGASVSGYNGLTNVTVVDANTFTYQVGANLAPNPGTAIAQDYNENHFAPVASAQVLDVDYVQDPSNGIIYSQDITDLTDNNLPIHLKVVTERWDGGNTLWKFLRRISLVADIESSNAVIAYSDSDYQSLSKFRTMNLNQGQRPTITPGGRFRRRAFVLRHTAATPFRAEALELEVYEGDF